MDIEVASKLLVIVTTVAMGIFLNVIFLAFRLFLWERFHQLVDKTEYRTIWKDGNKDGLSEGGRNAAAESGEWGLA